MPVIASPALIGRQDEVAKLSDALAVAASGRLAVVLIEGEPGIGKSRLIDETLAEAKRRGFTVLRGAADEVEHSRPFGALVEAFAVLPDQDASSVVGLLDNAFAREGPTSYAVVDAFVDAVERKALASPLLLAVDDLQWADASTMLVVRAVAHRLADLPIAIVGAFRPVPRRPDLEVLVQRLAAEGAFRLSLRPLREDDLAELVSQALGTPAGPTLLAATRTTSGNPFYALELVRGFDEEHAIHVDHGVADIASPGLPPSLRLTILRRLSFLPTESLDDLKMACILGSIFTMRALTAVTGRSAAQIARALDHPLRAGLVEGRGDVLAFRHDLIREALYEDMPIGVRKGLHREAARLLEEAGEPVERLATHVALGAEQGDSAAVRWLLDSGRALLRRSESDGLALFELADELADGPDRNDVAQWLAAILPNNGRVLDGERIAREALARGPDPECESFLRVSLLTTTRRRGALTDELEQANRVLRLPSALLHRPQVLALLADCCVWIGEIDAAAAWSNELALIDDDYARCGTAMQRAQLSLANGDVNNAVGHAEHAVAVVGAVWNEALGRLLAHLWLGMSLIDADRLDDAHAELRRGRRQADERGVVAHVPLYQSYLSVALYLRGDWDDALAEAEAGLDIANEAETRQWIETPLAVLARVALHRGDREAAERIIDGAERAEPTNPIGALLIAWCRALMHEADGDAPRAAETLGPAWDGMRQRKNFLLHRCIAPDLVRMSLASGDRARATRVTVLMEDVATLAGVPSSEGAAQRCRGLLDDDAAVLRRAVDAYRRSPRPVELARACEEAGAALVGSGDVSQARALLEEALATYERVGALVDVTRARAALRRAGVRRVRQAFARRPASGWESLTVSEVQVVRLVAEGLTNPEVASRLFVSRHTVRAHLRHVFAKLGCSSRGEVAALARKR